MFRVLSCIDRGERDAWKCPGAGFRRYSKYFKQNQRNLMFWPFGLITTTFLPKTKFPEKNILEKEVSQAPYTWWTLAKLLWALKHCLIWSTLIKILSLRKFSLKTFDFTITPDKIVVCVPWCTGLVWLIKTILRSVL